MKDKIFFNKYSFNQNKKINKIKLKSQSKEKLKIKSLNKNSYIDKLNRMIEKNKYKVLREVDINKVQDKIKKINIPIRYISKENKKNSLNFNKSNRLSIKSLKNNSKTKNNFNKSNRYSYKSIKNNLNNSKIKKVNKLIIPNIYKNQKKKKIIDEKKITDNYINFCIWNHYKIKISKFEIFDFLKKHDLNYMIRNKVIDWIIEVLYKYNCTDQTFFICISIIDKFLKKYKKKLEIEDLHLLGVTAMFIAVKYEEIYPISINVFSKNISHDRITTEEIIQFEAEILLTLNFELTFPNIYDISIFIIEALNYKKIFNEKQFFKFKSLFNFISKAILFDYSFYINNKLNCIIGSIIFLCFNFTNNNKNELQNEKKDICNMLGINIRELEIMFDHIYLFCKNFKIKFYKFENILEFNKFTEF